MTTVPRRIDPIPREDGNGHDTPPAREGLGDLTDRQLLEETVRTATFAQELAGKAARAAEQAGDSAANAWAAIKGLERSTRRLEAGQKATDARVAGVEVGVLEAIARLSHETQARVGLEAQLEEAQARARQAKRLAEEAAERCETTGQYNLREIQRVMRESQREEALTEAARAAVAVADRPRPSDSSDLGKRFASIALREKEQELEQSAKEAADKLTARADRRKAVIAIATALVIAMGSAIIGHYLWH